MSGVTSASAPVILARILSPTNVDDLRARITGALADVTPDMLHRTWREIHYRWDICRATPGSKIEL
jgi:hypothetical protein